MKWWRSRGGKINDNPKSKSGEMYTVRKLILGSAIVAGAFLALVLVFEWLYFLALIYQYSIQFAILIGVGIALYYAFDGSNDAKK